MSREIDGGKKTGLDAVEAVVQANAATTSPEGVETTGLPLVDPKTAPEGEHVSPQALLAAITAATKPTEEE